MIVQNVPLVRPSMKRLDPELVAETVRRALAEDLGSAGDITTRAVLSGSPMATGRIVALEEGVVAGVELAVAVLRQLDSRLEVQKVAPDGTSFLVGTSVLQTRGRARALLGGERVALNLLGHLSGIATATNRMVEAIAGTDAIITCTRKTAPGLRALEKYAVRCGGGHNHRFGLDDAVLIKDNHIELAGGVGEAIRRARQYLGPDVLIQVEVENLAELEEALVSGSNAILLDNMALDMLRRAVELASGRALLEASGGVTLKTVREVAETGVDRISVGALTHSVRALNLSMEVAAD